MAVKHTMICEHFRINKGATPEYASCNGARFYLYLIVIARVFGFFKALCADKNRLKSALFCITRY
jgi:hypothetical protein